MSLRIDHVTIAGPDLDRLRGAFAAAGLETAYGGPHSNGVTHMALLGFDDGSYIELISTLEPRAPSPLWDAPIREGAGPCAWAVIASDVAGEAERLRGLGVTVEGPLRLERRRPDGRLAEWDMAFPGEHPPGAVLPFFLRDRTPRALRVEPSPAVAGTELRGIDAVVIGVRDLESAVRLFRAAYGWEEPVHGELSAWGARLAQFDGTPVILAAPSGDGWLARRTSRFGDLPCAFLLASEDLARSERRFGDARTTRGSLLGAPVAWLDPEALAGTRVGLRPLRR